MTRALIEAGEQHAIHAFTLEVRVGMRLRSIFMKSWDLSRRESEKDFMKTKRRCSDHVAQTDACPVIPCFQEYMCWFIISLYNGRGGENHAEL